MPSSRTHLHFLIGLIISAVAAYLSLRKVDFKALAAALQSVNYALLVAAFAGQLLSFLLKGTAWRYLLLPAKKSIRVTSTTTVLIIGLMINNIFPAKMGELARAYFMGEKEGLPKTLCLSTVFIEHLLDILVLSAFLVILLPYVALPDWLRTSGMLIGGLALGLILFLVLMVRNEEKFLARVEWALARLPLNAGKKIGPILHSAVQGIRVINGRYIFYALTMLLSMWITTFAVAYLVLTACGLAVPFRAAVMVIVFAAFGKIIPSSPGAIGTFHFLVILVLMSFQVTKEAALGAAIILHGLGFLTETFLGIVALIAGNLSLSGISGRLEST
jgi:glycosyltransferase 2 family protein